jgi:hypothetical protein
MIQFTNKSIFLSKIGSILHNFDDFQNFCTGQWTVYSRLCSDSEDESAAQGGGRTRRSASTPPADRSRLLAERSRHDGLTWRIGRSPSSERRMAEEASSVHSEAFSAGCLRQASAEPRGIEAASSYVTEEFEGGLTLSTRAEGQCGLTLSKRAEGQCG